MVQNIKSIRNFEIYTYRKLEEVGTSSDCHTPISNHELDEVIRSIKIDHPNDGEVFLRHHLVSVGIRVTRDALQSSVHCVNCSLALGCLLLCATSQSFVAH